MIQICTCGHLKGTHWGFLIKSRCHTKDCPCLDFVYDKDRSEFLSSTKGFAIWYGISKKKLMELFGEASK